MGSCLSGSWLPMKAAGIREAFAQRVPCAPSLLPLCASLGELNAAEAVSSHITSSMKTQWYLGHTGKPPLLLWSGHFCFVTRLGYSTRPQLWNEVQVVTAEEWITNVRSNYFAGKSCGWIFQLSKIGSVVKVCKNSGGVAWVGRGRGVLLALAEFHWCQRSQQGLT